MRLIHVCFNEQDATHSQQLEELIQGLAELQIKQQLVCPTDSRLHQRLKHQRHLHLLTVNSRLQGHFKVPKTGLVFAHDLEAASWARWQQRLRGTPWFFSWKHSDKAATHQLNPKAIRGCLALVVNSPTVESQLREELSQPIKYIPDPVSSLATHPLRITQLRSRYQGRFVIGHWGHFEQPNGGQEILALCAEHLQADYPNLVFLMLGEGPDYQALKENYQERTNMDWLGSPEHLGDYFSLMNVFIDPASRASSIQGLLQAMSFHIPVIASRVSGFNDLIKHRSNGLLFKPGDPGSLEEMIKVLYHSTPLRTRLSRDAKQGLYAFSPEQVALEHRKVYWALIKNLKAPKG